MRLAVLTAVLIAASPARAQVSVNVVMQVDREHVQPGEVLHLAVRADLRNAGEAEFEIPDLPAFDVLSRHVETPVQFAIGNQIVQETTIHHFTLRARDPGAHDVGPAVVRAAGQRFESNPLTIHVGGGAEPDLPPEDGIDATTFDPNGFVRMYVDRSSPYVGQQTTVTIYMYLPLRAGGSLAITPEPTTEGFWTHDLLSPDRNTNPEINDVQGYRFAVYVLRRFAAFPLRAGELTIGATGVTVSSSNPFGRMLGVQEPPGRTFMGSPVTLTARALPNEGRPPTRGPVHVGTLELRAELDRAQVATGDAVQLSVTAQGTGQMEHVELALPTIDGLRVLEPEIDDRISTPRDVVSGTRTMRWLIVPERAGTYTIPAFEIAVFDPIGERYSVARTTALRLEAAGNAVAEAEPEPDAPAERRLDIRPIHTRSELVRERASFVDAPWLLSLFAIGPLLFAGAIAVRVAKRRWRGAGARNPKRAQREAKKRLAAARKHAGAGEARELYAAVASALKEVLEARLGQPVGRFTHGELRRHLVERGMDATLAESVVDELEGCDFARFSAAGVRAEEMESCLSRAHALIERLDRFTPKAEGQ